MSRSGMPIAKIFRWAKRFKCRRKVHLGAVAPGHVRVEAYHGEADNGGIKNPSCDRS